MEGCVLESKGFDLRYVNIKMFRDLFFCFGIIILFLNLGCNIVDI